MKITSNNLFFPNKINVLNNNINKNIEKLSSGKRINSSSDSPSDILRLSRLNSQIRGNSIGIKNAQSGISMLQVAEEASSEMKSIGMRLKELSVAYNTDTISVQDKKEIESETQNLIKEINNIQKNTKFNGINVFENKDICIQYGANVKESSSFNLKEFDFSFNSKVEVKNTYSLNEFINKIEEKSLDINDFKIKGFKEVDTNEDKLDLKINFHKGIEEFKLNVKPISNQLESSSKKYKVAGTRNEENINGEIYFDSKTESFVAIFLNDSDEREVFLGKGKDISDINDSMIFKKNGCKTTDCGQGTILRYENIITNKEYELSFEDLKNNKDNSYLSISSLNKNIVVNQKNDSIEITTLEEESKFNSNYIENKIIKPLSDYQSYLGLKINEFERVIKWKDKQNEIQLKEKSNIEDVDMAKEIISMTKNQISLEITRQLFNDKNNNDRRNIFELLK